MPVDRHPNKTRFRVTAWPDRIAIPHRFDASYTLDVTASALVYAQGSSRVAPGHETYLALYALDLTQPKKILEFANKYGHLDGVELNFRLDEAYPDGPLIDPGPDADTLAAEREMLMRANPTGDGFELLEDFRYAAKTLNQLTTAWRIISGQAEADSSSGERPESPEDATGLLQSRLPALLGRFIPRLAIQDQAGETLGMPEVAIAPLAPPPYLFEICAAELFNHITSQASYKTCANETCGKLFALQTGRAVHGQHRRTGVKYCSAACSNAQSQRRSRRRAAAK